MLHSAKSGQCLNLTKNLFFIFGGPDWPKTGFSSLCAMENFVDKKMLQLGVWGNKCPFYRKVL